MAAFGSVRSWLSYLDLAYPGVLVVMGTLDPDWADPRAEGSSIVAALPSGGGRLELIEGTGHYPHDQFPDQVVALMLAFLQPDSTRA